MTKKFAKNHFFSKKNGRILGSCKRSCTFRVAYKVQVLEKSLKIRQNGLPIRYKWSFWEIFRYKSKKNLYLIVRNPCTWNAILVFWVIFVISPAPKTGVGTAAVLPNRLPPVKRAVLPHRLPRTKQRFFNTAVFQNRHFFKNAYSKNRTFSKLIPLPLPLTAKSAVNGGFAVNRKNRNTAK